MCCIKAFSYKKLENIEEMLIDENLQGGIEKYETWNRWTTKCWKEYVV